MTKMNQSLLFIVPLLSLLGCSSTMEPKTVAPLELEQPIVSGPVYESGKWHGWLDKFEQKDGSYRLNISGEVILPNPAFDFEWSIGPMDRMNPPGLTLYLKPVKRDVMSIQVMTTKTVSFTMETPISHFRHVSVYCGETLLGKMVDVTFND